MKDGPSPEVRSIFAQAVGHHQAGRLDEAVACYRQALLLKPDLAAAHNNLGNALCEQGKPEEAEASYRRALALQPELGRARTTISAPCFMSGTRWDEAVAVIARRLPWKPRLLPRHMTISAPYCGSKASLRKRKPAPAGRLPGARFSPGAGQSWLPCSRTGGVLTRPAPSIGSFCRSNLGVSMG